MNALKWWPLFALVVACWAISVAVYWLLWPVRVVQVEAGGVADALVGIMRDMVESK